MLSFTEFLAEGKTTDEEKLASALVSSPIKSKARNELIKKLEKYDPKKIPLSAVEAALKDIVLSDSDIKKFMRAVK